MFFFLAFLFCVTNQYIVEPNIMLIDSKQKNLLCKSYVLLTCPIYFFSFFHSSDEVNNMEILLNNPILFM